MIFSITMMLLFASLMVLGGWLIDGIDELRQIKRSKLIRAHRNHPAGRNL